MKRDLDGSCETQGIVTPPPSRRIDENLDQDAATWAGSTPYFGTSRDLRSVEVEGCGVCHDVCSNGGTGVSVP